MPDDEDRPQTPPPAAVAGHERFRPGDPVPWFHAATDRNPRYAFDSVAGRYVLGGFRWSSQHPEGGSCDGHSEAAIGSGTAGRDSLAWTAGRGTA